jgi:DoxX-like family
MAPSSLCRSRSSWNRWSRSAIRASANVARLLGVLAIVSTILYAIPRTSVLGAILLTGYLGGAIATQLRIGSPPFTHLLFGVYLGLMVWGGLYLRDERLRALIPLRR